MHRGFSNKYVKLAIITIVVTLVVSNFLYFALEHKPVKSQVHELEVIQIKDEQSSCTKFDMPSGGVADMLSGKELPFTGVLETVSDDVLVKTTGWSMSQVSTLVILGYFTWEDFLYLTAVGHENFTTWEGAYAVMCCVRNRLEQNDNYNTIKDVVTAPGQFEGFHDPYSDTAAYEKYCTDVVVDAAVSILLGGESIIGDCYYFYGRVQGYDLWADADVDVFYNYGNNIFFNEGVHNKSSGRSSRDILIYNQLTGNWLYPSGTAYNR